MEDITDFVTTEHQKVVTHKIGDLDIPFEEKIELNDELLEQRLGLTK